MLDHAWIIPLLPAVSFVLILLFGKRLPYKGSEIGIVGVAAAWVLSVIVLIQWISRAEDHDTSPIVHATTWWQSGLRQFNVGIQLDGLAVVLLFVVTTVSLLVHIYSTEYLAGDRRYTHYFAALSLFTGSMLFMVSSSTTLGLLFGWEGTSVCSFMLIGHWWEEKPNSNAALKAFFTTRTGDIGLLIGIAMTYWMANSFDIATINRVALHGDVSHALVLVTAVALFIAVIGKSGQFPLHTWLPDAMAGPTPVSALIHAATMVVAGVYLVARLYGVFYSGFSIDAGGVNLVALVGGVTVIVGAALAFVQNDIKKVLAYSTISQLGYMVMGLGVGAWTAAVFHLFTHAFFKADLFLGAGSVSHSGSHHSFDMKHDMGGLKKHMPVTFWTFMIGTLALAGIFPLAGFWSKDEILAGAHHNSYDAFVVVGLIGAFMTAAYMTRCVYLTFFGEYRGHGHPHESPKRITVPLIILTGLAVVSGFVNAVAFGITRFEHWFEPGKELLHELGERASFPELHHPDFGSTDFLLAVVSVSIALLGIAAAVAFYTGRLRFLENLSERNAAARLGKSLLVNKLYLDVLYTDVIVGSVKGPFARAAYWVNQNVIDALVKGVGGVTRRIGRFTYEIVDQKGVDGAINGIAKETGHAGELLRRLQTGRVQRYALMMFATVGLFSLALWIST